MAIYFCVVITIDIKHRIYIYGCVFVFCVTKHNISVNFLVGLYARASLLRVFKVRLQY